MSAEAAKQKDAGRQADLSKLERTNQKQISAFKIKEESKCDLKFKKERTKFTQKVQLKNPNERGDENRNVFDDNPRSEEGSYTRTQVCSRNN